MTNLFCRIIAWGALALAVLIPAFAIYFLQDIGAFKEFARTSLQLPIQWQTVGPGQLYGLWGLTAAYLSLAVVSLYYLFSAFNNFAKGQYFTGHNSVALKRFAIFLFAQACVKPIHGALASVVLSINHPAGQKMLAVTIGSNELRNIAVAMVLWVISELLTKGRTLEDENNAFV